MLHKGLCKGLGRLNRYIVTSPFPISIPGNIDTDPKS